MNPQILLAAGASTVISSALLAVVIPWLRSTNRYDLPGERSSHSVPVPRGGGLALAGALVGGGLIAQAADGSASEATARLWPLLVLALAMAALGLAEDFAGLRIRSRLLVQSAIAATGAVWLVAANDGMALWALPIAMVVVLYVNVANFMDGVNGISGLHGVVVGATYLVVGNHLANPGVSVGAVILLGCSLGFLPWNAPKARVFLGDSGSYLIGAMVSALAASAFISGASPEMTVAPASVYLADVGWTLASRYRRGESLLEAHRSHVYQRLAEARGSHLFSASAVALATVFVIALAAIGASAQLWSRVGFDVAAIIVLIVYLLSPTLAGSVRPRVHGKASTWRTGAGPSQSQIRTALRRSAYRQQRSCRPATWCWPRWARGSGPDPGRLTRTDMLP